MVMASINNKMDPIMKVNGMMTCKMVKALNIGRMGINILVSI